MKATEEAFACGASVAGSDDSQSEVEKLRLHGVAAHARLLQDSVPLYTHATLQVRRANEECWVSRLTISACGVATTS